MFENSHLNLSAFWCTQSGGWNSVQVFPLTTSRPIAIIIHPYTRLRRAIVSLAILLVTVASVGLSQFATPVIKFFENGGPTRTGPDAAMFPDTPFRTKLDLSGRWNYSLDGRSWNPVSIPSAYDFTGRVIFQRTFEVKAEMLDRYTFSFVAYGINYQSEVTVNGNFIGRHLGGYSSFVVPIPPNVLQVGSENVIKIAVDNELTPKTTLPLRQQVGGWRSYGGIFRDIYLLATPRLAIEDMQARADVVMDAKGEVKSARIYVRGEVADHGFDLATPGGLLGFQVEIQDKLSGEMVGRSGISPLSPQVNKSASVTAELILSGPKLWSPDTPDLYVVKSQIVRVVNKEVVVLDEYQDDIGIRELKWKEGKLLVNGSVVLLKGLLWQEDHETFASAMTYEALEHDVASMKAVGANLVRFLYPPHPYMLNLCDRYGLFVMEEIPVVGVPGEILEKDYYQDLVTSYARDMVDRDRHHVSVLAWGIGDELETTTAIAPDYINATRNIIRSMDPRSVYFASHALNDACFEYVDLVAWNTYGSEPKEARDALKRNTRGDKPVVIIRYGRDVEPGNHNGYSDPLSMESQARYAMQMFEVIKEQKIAGGVLWSFNDWRTDRAALTAHSKDPYLHAMGIVSYEREKRIAFDVTRALFNGEKVQALPIGNYSSNAPIIFVVAGFVALIFFAFLYNGNRRFRDCVNRSLFRTYNFFADVRDQRIITYLHSLFLAAIISVTLATVLASILVHYRDNLLLDNLMSQILSDALKEWLVRLIWSPLKFIVTIAAVIFFKMVFLSLLVKLFSMMVRARVYFYHAFSITMWSMLPYVILIPVSMIMFRLMETNFYVMPIFGLIAIVSLWVVIRLLKGISIIYDVFPLKVYAVGMLVILAVSMALYGYLDYTKSTTVYLKYMMQTIKNSV